MSDRRLQSILYNIKLQTEKEEKKLEIDKLAILGRLKQVEKRLDELEKWNRELLNALNVFVQIFGRYNISTVHTEKRVYKYPTFRITQWDLKKIQEVKHVLNKKV